jgi:hypothetical protein
MTEPKPLASLSGSLLARKGAARPAMRPQMQHFPRIETHAAIALEDLGWNDMGDADETRHVADILPLTPAPKLPEVDAQNEAGDREAAAQLAENARQIAEAASITAPAKPEVILQREEMSARLESVDLSAMVEPAPERLNGYHAPALVEAPKVEAPKKQASPSRRSALATGRRAAFTLRLDSERHLKLRLASAIRNRSAQQLVTEALDALLGEMPELETLAAQVKRN